MREIIRLGSVVTAGVLMLAAHGAARGQEAATAAPIPGLIDGAVTDSSLAPLDGATITIFHTSVRVATGPSGRFRIQQVPPGQYLIIVQRLGFRPASGIIDVTPNDTIRLAYTLDRAVANLAATVVTEQRLSVRMSEFESRRRSGDGQFITQAEIERHGAIYTSDLLRNVKGFTVVPNRATAENYLSSSRVGGCKAEIFVDGIRRTDSKDLDQLPRPSEIAGIELYTGPATTPPQFAGMHTTCGVLLIWTKDGG